MGSVQELGGASAADRGPEHLNQNLTWAGVAWLGEVFHPDIPPPVVAGCFQLSLASRG
jgi:hypothetical protein